MTKQNMTLFIYTKKAKEVLIKPTLMIYLNQSILQLNRTYKNVQKKGLGWITDSVIILIFQSIIPQLVAVT